MSNFPNDSQNLNSFAMDNLIVNYLPTEISENELQSLFEPFGFITHLKIVRDRATKKSLGYGFVKFESETAASNAMHHLNGYRIGRKQIKVSVARPSCSSIQDTKLYVSYLPPEYTQQQVIHLFSQFGKIVECRLLFDSQTGKSRSTAFIQFDTKQEALNALALNGSVLDNSSRHLLVKFAEDHSTKRFDQQEISSIHPSHQAQQQLYFDNTMMGNTNSHDHRRGNNVQQQLSFDMYGFYGANNMPWLGIPPYYNFGLPTEQSRSNQTNDTTNNFQISQLRGQNQFNSRNYH